MQDEANGRARLTGGEMPERRLECELTKEIHGIILSGDFNSVNLQKISDYINDVTPNNSYGRRLSERLPQRVERTLYDRAKENAIDALYGRAAESAVSPHERVSATGRRAIEKRKKEALEQWAKATGMPSSATLQIAEFKALQSIWTSGLQGAKIGHSSGFQTSRE